LKKSESLASQDDRASLIRSTSLKAIKETKEPIKITWRNLNYEVVVPLPKSNIKDAPKTTKRLILQNCTGYALPG